MSTTADRDRIRSVAGRGLQARVKTLMAKLGHLELGCSACPTSSPRSSMLSERHSLMEEMDDE